MAYIVAATLALSAGLGILLFLLQRRVRTCLKRLGGAEDRLADQTAASDVRELQIVSRLEALEHARSSHAEGIAQLESVNLNRHGQVLRLHQKGNSVSEIASALHIGQGEVSLTIKVHEISRTFRATDKDPKALHAIGR